MAQFIHRTSWPIVDMWIKKHQEFGMNAEKVIAETGEELQ